MNTIAEDLPKEQQRCREILENAQALGLAGGFLATQLKQSLSHAERAAAEGDVVAMIRAYEDLQSYKE
jgi:hypothetical protein